MEDQIRRATGDGGELPVCSIIIVNYNGKRFLKDCFTSLLAMDYPADRLDVMMIDNGSSDGSVEYVEENFPTLRAIKNPENSFCKAVNLGIREARGDLIGLLNNDTVVDKDWLKELVKVLLQYEKAGAAGGKIIFKNGLINSTGIEEIRDCYFQDRGFEEEDMGQYDTVEEVRGISGGAILYRRACLEDVGPMDEDFVIYFEDVDYAYRLQKKGWKTMYTPHAKIYHEFQGSSKTTRIGYYYCNRNRLLYLAKHFPEMLPKSIKTAHVYLHKEHDMMFEFLPGVFKKLIESQNVTMLRTVIPQLVKELTDVFGARKMENLLARLEVAFGYRKLKVGIYDHALHFVGGGQKYVCTLASVLQDRYDVTYICNKPVTLAALREWYNLDVSRIRLKIIPLKFYEDRNYSEIDASIVTAATENPFVTISEESLNYDFFLNANMMAKCLPLCNRSIMVCHFPDVEPGPHFVAHKYTNYITNGQYTTGWLLKRWGRESDRILYPPVNMYGKEQNGSDPLRYKEGIILSVARFEQRGSKKQKEMVKAFNILCENYPELMRSWRLWLVGGAVPGIPYADDVKRMVKSNPRIQMMTNLSLAELHQVYAKSQIFWHACGLGVDETKEPELIEHFGMTTVEAMQNYCAPVVINGGGQKEIVEHGKSGFLFKSLNELCEYTYRLISDPELLKQVMCNAYERSHQFNQERFAHEALAFFESLEKEYTSLENPSIAYVRTTY